MQLAPLARTIQTPKTTCLPLLVGSVLAGVQKLLLVVQLNPRRHWIGGAQHAPRTLGCVT